MALRLALAAPGAFDGCAAIAANVPVPDSTVCPQQPVPLRSVLVKGTRDPINPHDRGRVAAGATAGTCTERAS